MDRNNEPQKQGMLSHLSAPLVLSAVILLLGTALIVMFILSYREPEPDPMHELLVSAEGHFKLGEYEEALSKYNECIEQFPDAQQGYIGMYHSLEQLGRQAEAADIFFSLPDAVSSADITAIRNDINSGLIASYRASAEELGFILNDSGTYIKTCTGKDYWYYGWCEKTGVLSLSFADFDGDRLNEGAAIVIRSHEPDADIKGTFAFDTQSDAYLLIYESDGSVHERIIARCFDSRESFVDVYLADGRFYVETGSRIETDTVRTYSVYEWTGSSIDAPVLLSGTGDITLTLTDDNAGVRFYPSEAYADGHDGYMNALSHRLERYGLSGGAFGSLEQASFTGGVRLCLASGGISGSPGMKLTGKCDCSLMSQFIGYGHDLTSDPLS